MSCFFLIEIFYLFFESPNINIKLFFIYKYIFKQKKKYYINIFFILVKIFDSFL